MIIIIIIDKVIIKKISNIDNFICNNIIFNISNNYDYKTNYTKNFCCNESSINSIIYTIFVSNNNKYNW